MREECAGGIVLGDSGTIALVWSKHSQAWLFPKGRIDAGESTEEAARREILEETGLDGLEYIDDLGSFSRPGFDGRPGKEIHMYLFAAAAHTELRAENPDEIEKVEWIPFAHVARELGAGEHEAWFSADRAWFTTVFERVRQAIQRD